ncbi:MAG: zinc ABC transporter substrate-binding protein [Aestuariivirga sp.]
MRLLTACLASLLLSTSALAAPKVIASIMPVHSIVANVMGSLGSPGLLLLGKNSEHSASLSPAQIASLGQADIVFMIGGGLEHKLGQVSGSEAVNGKKFLALADAPGIRILKIRKGINFEVDSDEELPDAGDPQYGFALKYNPHIWLDPENAKAMAKAVAAELGKIDPGNAATYQANATAYLASLDQLEAEISAAAKPIQGKPFIVFHDAYPYFESRFGLMAVGSISDASAAAPSAKWLAEIKDKLARTRALCVFREPQFDSKYVNVVLEGSSAREGVLDAMGYDLTPGPSAYAQILRNIATSAKACLAGE